MSIQNIDNPHRLRYYAEVFISPSHACHIRYIVFTIITHIPAVDLYARLCYTERMGFKHSHSLGQNFLSDGNLLAAIAADAELSADDTAVEVGAGMGALTVKLASTGARVFAFEIDSRLEEYLRPLEATYPRLTVTFADFMKCEPDFGGDYKAIANLPYYITTPVLFRFLDDPHCLSVTVMVQKEVAERMIAPPGGKDYGALSVAAQLAGDVRITRRVGRHMFDPPPNVDSAVVRIRKTGQTDESVKRLVRAAFSMRRKTLVNCLSGAGYGKDNVLSALSALGLDPAVRGERLTPPQFVRLAGLLS